MGIYGTNQSEQMIRRFEAEEKRANSVVSGRGLFDAAAGGRQAYDKKIADLEAYRNEKNNAGSFTQAEIDQYQRANQQAKRDYLKGQGIKDPASEFAEQYAELLKAKGPATNSQIRDAANQLADSLMGTLSDSFADPVERRAKEKAWIDSHYKGEDADRRNEKSKANELAAMGVTDWKKQYSTGLKSLDKALRKGDINDDQYMIAERNLRRQAVQGAAAGVSELTGYGAYGKGSREAYSLQAGAQINSGREELQKKANEELVKIRKNLEKKANNVAFDMP